MTPSPRPLPSALSPFIEQCDGDGERGSWPRPKWHLGHCGFCGKHVTLDDGLSFISDWDERISYPTPECPHGVRAIFEHKSCGPDVGYWIELRRLAKDRLYEPGNWLAHLNGKDWFGPRLVSALESARALAKRLTEAAAPKPIPAPKPVTKPYTVTQRPSRVSDNPRSISKRTRTRILERDGFKCRRCGNGPDVAPLVIDHIVPVAKGGTADESNLQTLCRPCNAGKRDHAPHEHDLRGQPGAVRE